MAEPDTPSSPRLPVTRTLVVRTLIGIPAAMLLQGAVHQYANLQADVGSVGAFVAAMGTLYSVLTGFTVITVWQQFIDTDRAVKREARNLRELWRYVGYVEDADGVSRARTAIERYRDQVLQREWPEMASGKISAAAEEDYFVMADAVNAIRVTTAKDVPAWAEAVRTLGEVSDARGERLTNVATRMPAVLKMLLYIATLSLLIGIVLLRFEQPAVGVTVLAGTLIVSLLVLEVIHDLDEPFDGAWAISSAPLERIPFGKRLESAGRP